ncbi:MAG: sulfatase, partial [Planctomycetaceae bacterium]|nr:sulfatase [Planctomycetaceae bacterium]
RAADRPNVIFFLSDDHRADFLGCAGHPIIKTPHIDRLAAEGVRFSNAFVTTSICAASRASIFTGLYERTHRFTFGTPPIREEHVAASYPAVLKAAGYRTGFIGKFGVGMAGNGQKEIFDFFKPINRSPYFHKMPDGTLRHETDLDADAAIEFIKGNPAGQPFCLSVSFNAAHAEDADKVKHYPWMTAMDGLYDDAYIPPPRLASNDIFESHPEFLKQSMNRDRWFWRWDTPEKYEHNIRAYYRLISGIDLTIGRVLKEVERRGLADNTAIIFSGDNGYYAGERQFAGKWSHYDQSLRVPLVIYDPRIPEMFGGRVFQSMILNADVAPTIVELAGVEIPAHYQGRSLVPWMNGRRPSDWRTDFFCEHLMDNPSIPKWEGVRGERYVYARYFEQEPPFEFLHDLQADPDQLKNFVGDPAYADALQTARQRMVELRDSYGGEYTAEKFPSTRNGGVQSQRNRRRRD